MTNALEIQIEELRAEIRNAEALLAAYGKPDPADIPGAEELRRGLTVRQLRGLTELMKRYCLECRYNVGVGHVLGALCAGWEKLL